MKGGDATGHWPISEATTGPATAPDGVTRSGAPCLVVAAAPHAEAIGRSFTLGPDRECIIGRSQEAHLQVEDPGVSRQHSLVKCAEPGTYVLSDLRSANGTYLNGRRVRRAVLREGDRIQLGTATVLRFSAHQRLDQRERRQRQALAIAGIGTWEWDVTTHRLSFAGGPDWFERTEGSDAWQAVHTDDRQRLREDLQLALATGATGEVECRVVSKANRISWVSLRGELLRDETGVPTRVVGALVDVTVRKRAELELRRQALMFECMSDAVMVVDLSGAILDWNPAAERILGYTRDDVLGRGPGELLEPRVPESFLPAATAGIAAAGNWKGERRLRRKNGGPCQAELEAIPLRDATGRHVADLVMCRDIGEQRLLQAQFLLTDRLSAMGTLAAGVAHEINNPLGFIAANLGCLRTMLDGPQGQGLGPSLHEALSMLDDMREGVARIGMIVRELKEYSRGSGGDGDARGEVGRVVDYALRIVKSQTAKRARVLAELGDVPPVRMSEPQLGQVLVNLLINAAQAVDGDAAGNEIRVSTSRDEVAGMVLVRVSDTGKGIPATVLPRIFDPFFTTKPAGVGTGLGLFVCRNLIEAVGGTITVESRLGQGTTFTMALPVATENPAQAEEVESRSQSAARSGQ